jgi:hypothetical protein
MTKATLASLFALALSVSVMACSPEVPANPTYTKDVQPILAAHCVRCHGETLVPDPNLPTEMPLLCHLNRFGDDCSNPAACSFGAGSPTCTALSGSYIIAADSTGKRMPPPPSDPLNDWEIDVLTRWYKAPVE